MIIRTLFLSASLTLATVPILWAKDTTEAHSVLGNFVGTWTLKEDQFQQVWDGETVETLTIPNHITVCESQTAKSVACKVDANGFKGEIFWAFTEDADGTTLHHLSHFGDTRLGVGTGSVSDQGDLNNRIVFSDEPEGTYRHYEYQWVSPDEYTMMSRQYEADGTPTGNWYGGTFLRVPN